MWFLRILWTWWMYVSKVNRNYVLFFPLQKKGAGTCAPVYRPFNFQQKLKMKTTELETHARSRSIKQCIKPFTWVCTTYSTENEITNHIKLGNLPCDITVFLKLDPKHEQRLCGTPWKEKNALIVCPYVQKIHNQPLSPISAIFMVADICFISSVCRK